MDEKSLKSAREPVLENLGEKPLYGIS